jgi:gliding motility-associated-like protein
MKRGPNKGMKLLLPLLLITLISDIQIGNCQTPPQNDHCQDALLIDVVDNGYKLGVYKSDTSDLTFATRETAESCASQLMENGNCEKTIWYRFFIATTRNVSVSLKQKDSVIPEIFVGFNVYSTIDCEHITGNISDQFAPINKFGLSGNTCLNRGWYLVQVGGKQSTSGNVWIELNVDVSASDTFDNIDNPFLVKSEKSMRYSSCNSLEFYEYDPTLPSQFTQSHWAKVVIDSGYNIYDIFLEDECYYKMFLTRPNSVEIAKKAYTHYDGNRPDKNIYSFNDACLNSTAKDTFYVLLLTKSTNGSLRFGVNREKVKQQIVQPWNSSLTPDIIDLTANPFFQERKGLSCSSTLSNSHCSSIPSEYIFIEETDTQHHKFAGYQVIKVDDGMLSLWYDDYPVLVTIYKGDISKTCKLIDWKQIILHPDRYTKLCIDKGVYTVVYAYHTANIYDFVFVRWEGTNTMTRKHTAMNDPEDMGSFNPNTSNLFSDTILHTKITTKVTIDDVIIEGNLSYKEVYYSKSGSSSIITRDAYMYLFKGRASKGNATKIAGLRYDQPRGSYGYSSGWFGGNMTCFEMEMGYYTIVCTSRDINSLACDNNLFFVVLIGHPPCPDISKSPQTALPLNNNKNILEIADTLDKLNYRVTLLGCSDCLTKSTLVPNTGCPTSSTQTKPINRYYTFTITLPMTLQVENNNNSLFVGNCLLNPNLVLDSNLRISACENGVYCNLLPNMIYTVVIADYSGLDLRNYNLRFSEIRRTSNDFISNSMDLGNFKGSTSKVSNETVVSCHTNSVIHELPFQNYYSPPPSKTPQSFPYTPNTPGNNSWQTTWFTFTSDVSTNVLITFLDSSTFSNNFDLRVYQYLGDYDSSWTRLLNNGLDSSKLLFKEVMMFSRASKNIAFTLVNRSCSQTRYFICAIFRNQWHPRTFRLKLESKQKIYENEGDFCHDAQRIKIDNYGTFGLSTHNLCHTYGNSPFEDSAINIQRSTWFEIDLRMIKEFDLSIALSSSSPWYYWGYNLYAGNCGALTRITSSTKSNGYFRLPCMGSGKYYVQVFSAQSNYYYEPLNLALEVKVEPGQNPGCSPYDFKNPLSYFQFKGGCNKEDTINFTNLSSQGDDIEYTWLVNRQLFSRQKNIQISRHHPWITDETSISLLVKNRITGLADTFFKIYHKDTNSYFFNLYGPNNAFCFDTVTFTSKTNFPNKLAYEWSQLPLGYSNRNNYISGRLDSLVLFPNYPDRMYYLYAQSENCSFYDSIYIPQIDQIHRYFDTTLCEDQTIILSNSSGVFELNNSRLSYDWQTLSIDTPGTYIIGFTVAQYCYYYDTISVAYDYGPRTLTILDSIYDCNTDSTRLAYDRENLETYTWSTGDTIASIYTSSDGIYNLTGDFTPCRSLNYTAIVEIENVDTNLLKDTIICPNTKWELTNPYPTSFNVNWKQPNEDSIMLTDSSVRYIISMEHGRCLFTDEALIATFPNESAVIDSQYCDTTENMSMVLDGLNALNYDWYLNGGSSRFLNINDYGNYPVARISTKYCDDTIQYNIINSCSFLVWVPNVFSPNNDLLNDVFKPKIRSDYKSMELSIYNRWGNLLFTSRDGGWNGLYLGRLVPNGAYAYTVIVTLNSGKKHHLNGIVNVLR